jgi:hypothetical protein
MGYALRSSSVAQIFAGPKLLVIADRVSYGPPGLGDSGIGAAEPSDFAVVLALVVGPGERLAPGRRPGPVAVSQTITPQIG